MAKNRYTPLHVAAGASDKTDEHYAICELLLNNGANVNAVNADNATPSDGTSNYRSKFTKYSKQTN